MHSPLTGAGDRCSCPSRSTIAAWSALILHGLALVAFGRSNDESFYLAAIHHVQEGMLPYRDFCFPQGPVMPYVYAGLTALLPGGRLLAARLVSLALTLTAIWLLAQVADRSGGRRLSVLVVASFAVNPYVLHHLTLAKTYALVSVLFAGSLSVLARGAGGFGPAAVLLSLAVATRVVIAPVLVWLLAWGAWRCDRRSFGIGALAAFAVLAGTIGPLEVASRGGLHRSLYVPIAVWPATNAVTSYHLATHQIDGPGASADRKLSHVIRSLLAFGLPALALLPAIGSRLGITLRQSPLPPIAVFAGGALALLASSHLLAHRPYDEYQTVTFVLLVAFVVLVARTGTAQEANTRTRRRGLDWLAGLLAAAAVLSPIWRGIGCLDLEADGAVPARVRRAGEAVRRWTRDGGRVLALDSIVGVESGRPLHPLLAMGQFAYRPEWSTAECIRHGFINASLFIDLIRDGGTEAVLLAREDLLDGPTELRAWRVELRARVERVLRANYFRAGSVPGARSGRAIDVWIRAVRTGPEGHESVLGASCDDKRGVAHVVGGDPNRIKVDLDGPVTPAASTAIAHQEP